MNHNRLGYTIVRKTKGMRDFEYLAPNTQLEEDDDYTFKWLKEYKNSIAELVIMRVKDAELLRDYFKGIDKIHEYKKKLVID